MRSQRFLERPPAGWQPLRFLAMLFLAVGLMVAGPLPAALAATPTGQVPAVTIVVQIEQEVDTAVDMEEAERFDGSAHDAQLAETGAQRTLLLTLAGLLSIGAGLTAWWVSRRSKSMH